MYDSIRIQNFRGIRDLTISNLGRINLLVGANNVGKTSVLEALNLLLLGNDPLDFITLASRRRDWPFGVPVRLLDRLAFGQKWNSPIVVQGVVHSDSPDELPRATEQVVIDSREPVDSPMVRRLQTRQIGIAVDGTMTGDGVVIVHSGENALDIRAKELPRVDEYRYQTTVDPVTGSVSSGWPESPFGGCIAHWSWSQASEESLSENLSEAYESRDDTGLIESLRRFDARIERLFVSTQEYAIGKGQMRVPRPIVKAHVADSATAIPISLLGSGADRILDLLLASPTQERWLVLIDEVELGIYYENLAVLWNILGEQLHVGNAQLFVSTQSWECIEAAVRSARDWPDMFRMHRISRRDSELKVTTYDHEMAEAALELNFEVR